MSMYLDLYILFFEDMFQKYQQNGIKRKFQALDIFYLFAELSYTQYIFYLVNTLNPGKGNFI